jgi:hypothetical protein
VWIPYTIIFGAVGLVLVLFPPQVGSFGTIDFVQYWSAWNLLLQGKNPYDPALLHQAQSALASGSTALVFSWNPPWTYTMLAPFLMLPFTVAATAWLIFEVGALFFIAAQLPKALKLPSLGPVWGLVATTAFLPTLYSLRYGQLGILFTLSLICFLLAVNDRKFRLAGLALLPLSAKPHLFILCIIPGILWLRQIPREAMKNFLFGAIGGATILLLTTVMLEPLSIGWWLESMTSDFSSTSAMIPLQNWMAHTSVTAIRLLSIAFTGVNPTWPLFAVPLASCIATSLYFFLRKPRIEWNLILPPMLCLSLATSSYGWVFDQTILIPCQYLLLVQGVSHASSAVGRGILLLTISVQVIPLALTMAALMTFHYFFLFPWIYLTLLLAIPRAREFTMHIPGANND